MAFDRSVMLPLVLSENFHSRYTMRMTRIALASLLGVLVSMSVSGQEPGHLSGPAVNQPCMECGVIYEIKSITTERKLPGTFDESAPPTGPFINFPLTRKHDAKPQVGVIGSKEMREGLKETVYEVIVRFDDDRFTRIEVRDVSKLRVGNRVRVHQNRIEPVAKP